MPPFKKTDFDYHYRVDSQLRALRDHRDAAPGRQIPQRVEDRLLLATWNIANLGIHHRRDHDHRLIAELISWFDLVAVQEVNDDLTGFRSVMTHLPGRKVIFSDAAGNDERAAFIYDPERVELLDMVGEVAVPPRWQSVIRVPGSTQRFDGFDRNPYLTAFRSGRLAFLLVNVHLYYGGDTAIQKNRRFLEALAVARWADLQRRDPHAYTDNIIVLGDFNLEKVGWDDPIWRMLGERGLHLAAHSTYVGGSNIRDNRPYDQVAFFPGDVQDRLETSGVFDFDNAIFAHLWDTKPDRFLDYVQYHLSDHRLLWAAFNTT